MKKRMGVFIVLLFPLFAFSENAYQEFHEHRPKAQKCPRISAPECQRRHVGDSCVTVDYDIGAEVYFGYCESVGFPDKFGEVPCQCSWPR